MPVVSIKDVSSAITIKDMMSVVVINGVTKFYGKKMVLDNISFEIRRGEIFGLLGSNGAGKSTLISIILGIEKESGGKVTIFGSKINHKLKKKIALVPQENSFYTDFSVEKNMRFFSSIAGLKGKKQQERIDFLLKWLALDDFKNVKADYLSGGYQKLLNIAISIINDPDLIFFDEPTVGLDPKMRMMFWEKINGLRERGKTIILTTHYMDEAQKLCDKVVLLKKGKIIALGSPNDLIIKHGGIKVIVFKLANSMSVMDISELKSFSRQPSIFVKGNMIVVPFSQQNSVEQMTRVTEWIMGKGYKILSSTAKEPDLEDVFLNIIGERMVD